MKVKAIVVTLAALGLAWTGASWYTGKQVEDWYRAETEKANVRLKEAGLPNDLSVAIASYDRGVFSSKVHFALRLPERCGLPKELVLIDSLNHGPFPWSQIKQGNLRPALLASHAVLQEDAVTKPWFQAANGQSPLDLTSTVSFSREILGQIVLAPLTIEAASKSIKTSSARFDFFMFNDARAYNGTGSMGFLEIGETHGQFRGNAKIEGISIKYDLAQPDNSSLFLGQNDLSIKTIKASMSGMPVLSMSDVAEVSVSSEKDQKFALRHTATVGAWDIMGVNMPTINSAFEANSVNMTALNSLSTLYYDWAFNNACSAEGAEELLPSLSVEQQKTLNTALQGLLADKPSFTWSPFELKNQDGEIRLDVAAVLSTPEGISAQASSQELAAGSVHSLNGKLVVSKPLLVGLGFEALKKMNPLSLDDASIKKEVTQQVEKLSGEALASGFFSLDNDKLTSTLNYDKGVLSINGKVMPPEFLGNLRSAIDEKADKALF